MEKNKILIIPISDFGEPYQYPYCESPRCEGKNTPPSYMMAGSGPKFDELQYSDNYIDELGCYIQAMCAECVQMGAVVMNTSVSELVTKKDD